MVLEPEDMPIQHGCRRVFQIISGALVCAAASVWLLLPAVGVADPLLSGYGGPGQGQQVLLGSSLIAPPGGGTGSPPSTSAPGAAADTPSALARPSSSAPGATHAAHGQSAAGFQSAAGAGTRNRAAGSVGLARGRPSPTGVDLLGLAWGQLGLMLLATLLVIATGWLTRRFAGGPAQPIELKGLGGGSESV